MVLSLSHSARRIFSASALVFILISDLAACSYGQGVPPPVQPTAPTPPAAPARQAPNPPTASTPAPPSKPSAPDTTPASPPAAPKPAQTKQAPKPTQSKKDFLAQPMSLGDGERQWHPTRKALGFTVSGDDLSRVTINASKLQAYLTKLAPNVRRSPRDARPVARAQYAKNPLAVSGSSGFVPIKILPSREGATLDIHGSIKAIQSAVAQDPNVTHVVLAVKMKSPKMTEAKFAGIDSRVGHFVTHFNPGEAGRTQTVRLAIKLINGHFVQPGKIFSVNDTVGERTAARGFGSGKVFISGKMETQQGGGMCQVATTLFNAALLADLKIVDRQQHVRTVPYVKPGDDATVYWGQKDFKFENNTQTPIYISYVTTATHCICDLYGKRTPGLQVSVDDQYKRLGPRHYTAVLRRYVVRNGKRVNDYTAKSAYRWTPALDYNR